jgi:hypothetical protein
MTSYRDDTPVSRCVGVAEIAADLSVTKSNVGAWAERRRSTRFPSPVRELVMGNLYDLDEVRAWHQRWVATRRPREER